MGDHSDIDHTGLTGVGGGLADQGTITYLDATEDAAPATPSSGKVRIYAKADGRIYSKDDAGTEYGPFDAAGGGAGGSGYATAIAAETDLVAYWPCNDAKAATSVVDTEGGASLTAHTNTLYANGPGSSLTNDVDGGSVPIGYARIGRAAISGRFVTANPWSIEIWVVNSKPPSGEAIVGQWNANGAMLLFGSSISDLKFYWGGSAATFTRTAAQFYGRHHIVMTWDGTTQKLYWDGTEVTLTSPQTGTSTSPTCRFELGSYNNGTADAAPAFVASDIAVYSAALSSTQVSDHYTLGV